MLSERITVMRWTWVICVKEPDGFMSENQNFSEAYPEVAIREGADEITLRADEMETLRALINIDHIEFERWGPLLVDAEERVAASNDVPSNPCVSAETLKACALIGLHLFGSRR